MTTALTAAPSDSLTQFKHGVDSLLEKRDYFIQKILPKLIEGQDFYTIKGRRSLAKGGAEKLAVIYGLAATFSRDEETLKSFDNVEGLVAYVVTLTRIGTGEIVGQGRGAATYKACNNDANKTIKMAQKSAFIDGVIRSTGISDIFSQDIENMPQESVSVPAPQKHIVKSSSNSFPKNTDAAEDEQITEKQRNLLTSLIAERIPSREERERWFSEIESCSKFDASEMISSFLMSARR